LPNRCVRVHGRVEPLSPCTRSAARRSVARVAPEWPLPIAGSQVLARHARNGLARRVEPLLRLVGDGAGDDVSGPVAPRLHAGTSQKDRHRVELKAPRTYSICSATLITFCRSSSFVGSEP
jgi:hypothetical protein